MLVEKKRQREVGIPTSSLADIAFLLLLFFLVTTTIDLDKGIPLTLPEKGAGQARIHPENICNILINAQNEVLLDNEPVLVPEIMDRVRTKVEDRGLDKDGKPLLVVSIKTERQTDYDTFIQVLDQVKRSGATKISLAEPES
jgi:biopolymer transport protein ExbD